MMICNGLLTPSRAWIGEQVVHGCALVTWKPVLSAGAHAPLITASPNRQREREPWRAGRNLWRLAGEFIRRRFRMVPSGTAP